MIDRIDEQPADENDGRRLVRWIDSIRRIESLRSQAIRTLQHFYKSDDGGFRSGNRSARPWTLSHALCVDASLHAKERDELTFVPKEARELQLETLLTEQWQISARQTEPDPYTASVAISALTNLIALVGGDKRRAAPRIRSGYHVVARQADNIRKDRPEFARWRHPIFLYRMRKSLNAIEKGWRPYVKSPIAGALESLCNYMQERLLYFVGMCSAIPDDDDDALSLGYLVHALDTFDGYPNDIMIQHSIHIAITTLFRKSGVLRVQTIARDEKEGINISASPLEILTLLARSRTVRTKFADYSSFYEVAFDSLLATRREYSPRVPTRTSAPATPISLWMAEPWRGVERPEAWVNALVVEFLSAYLDLLRAACAPIIKADLNASIEAPRKKWSELADSGWKQQLTRDFLMPLSKRDPTKALPVCSILLFGPPGTSKTTIAKAIAHELKWPFILISPDQFAENGLEGVIRFGRQLFERLLRLENCVVLFDEVDELVFSRERGNTEKIGRFITTSMLPWIQGLHDKGKIVFIATTNHIRHFDPAIRRPGRFDFVLPVGPPTPAGRKSLLEESLNDNKLTAAEKKRLVESVGSCITQTAKRLKWHPTIGEVQKIAEAIVALLYRTGKSRRRVDSDKIQRVIERFGEHPQIADKVFRAFKSDIKQYRYPFEPAS